MKQISGFIAADYCEVTDPIQAIENISKYGKISYRY